MKPVHIRWVSADYKVHAIRDIRQATGMKLREARDLYDDVRTGKPRSVELLDGKSLSDSRYVAIQPATVTYTAVATPVEPTTNDVALTYPQNTVVTVKLHFIDDDTPQALADAIYEAVSFMANTIEIDVQQDVTVTERRVVAKAGSFR